MTTPTDDTDSTADTVDDDAALAASPEARHAEAEQLVRNYSLGGMAVALVPLPLVDLAGLVAVQLKMLHALARVYGVDFRADLGRAAAASLIGGVLPTTVTPALAFSLGKLIPVSGQLLGGGMLAATAGAATYAIGKVFIQHFAAGGTFLTFDPEAVRDYFEQQFAAGKQVAADAKPYPRRRTPTPETGTDPAAEAGDGA